MLEIAIKECGSVIIMDLSGDVDINASIFVERVGWCLDSGYKDILCNFEGVNILDYSGLSVLTIAYKNILNNQGRIKFANVPAHIKKILALVCLDKVFEIYLDEESALKGFEEDRVISEIQKKHLRRRFKRLPLDIDIQFKSKSEAKFHNGKVLNLSAVGLLVFTEEKAYPIGEILDIKISLLPLPGIIELVVEVVWLVEKEIQPQIFPGMGLSFYKIDSAMQEKIAEYVERNLSLDSTDCG